MVPKVIAYFDDPKVTNINKKETQENAKIQSEHIGQKGIV